MAAKIIHMTAEEFDARVRTAGFRTRDDVSITVDGRRLDTKAGVLAWWADVAPEVEAERGAPGCVAGACSD